MYRLLRASFALLLTLPVVRFALADGMFLPPKPPTKGEIAQDVKEYYLDEPEQHAILHFDGRRETLYLSVKYDGNAPEFAWVVPVPGLPEVEIATPGLVQDLAGFEYRLRLEAWKAGKLPGQGSIITFGGGGGGRSKPVEKPKPVQVVERKRIGIFDVSVLRAREAEALSNWLDENGFVVPGHDEAKAILKHYVEADMFFVALRVSAGTAGKHWLKPLSIAFDTDRPFFPLRVSAMHARPEVTTNVHVHAFLPVDGLSFSGRPRVGSIHFEQREQLFHAKDVPKCVHAFPELRGRAYSLLTFDGEGLSADQMQDLWIATNELEARDVDADRRWQSIHQKSRANWGRDTRRPKMHDRYRALIADYPRSHAAVRAWTALQSLEADSPYKTAERELSRARGQRGQCRFSDAYESCRRAVAIAPEIQDLAKVCTNEIRRAEETWIAGKWKFVEDAEWSSGYELSQFVELCIDRHRYDNLGTKSLKELYLKKAQSRFEQLRRDENTGIQNELILSLEQIEFLARRNAARSALGCELLMAFAPDHHVAKKAAEFRRLMQRGLREAIRE